MLFVENIQKKDIKELFLHLKRDFPPSERPPQFLIKRNLLKGMFQGVFLRDEIGRVGYAIITAPDGIGFILINFLGILPDWRSKGYGGRFIDLIAERFHGKKIIVEVEAPVAARDDSDLDIRKRRIRFYERQGFHMIHTKSVRIFGVEMEIMSKPKACIESPRELMHTLYRPTLGSGFWLRHIEVEE